MVNICPICGLEKDPIRCCLSYELSNISLELVLLDLPFSLEPYGAKEEPGISRNDTEIPDSPEHTQRTSHVARPSLLERPTRGLTEIASLSKSMPLFLRI